jgi:cellulose synthase/poly-beta-1,6-N-acetylglucosamine synthase-like glycosyltransferase
MNFPATIIFWGCLSLLLYIYGGYSLILYLFSKIKPARHDVREDHTPTVTILFAARNERVSLPTKLESIRQLDYPKERLQILIASDQSTDGTNEYLAQQHDLDFVVLNRHAGKNAALNELLPRATGELLFFTDANNLLHPHALRNAARHFADPSVGAVTGELIYTQDKEWNAVGRGTGLYWKYENWIKRSENRLGSVLVAAGSMLICRREIMQPLDPRIANDLEIPTRVGARGYQVLYDADCVGFEKPHTVAWEEFHRTSRIVARGFRGFLVLFPILLASPLRFWQFFSHKFLRWFTLAYCVLLFRSAWILRDDWLPFLTVSVGIAVFLIAFTGIFMIQREISSRWFRPCSLFAHLFIMNLAALWGIILTLAGHAPATWTIPQSTRES